MSDHIDVTVSNAAYQGHPAWAITCSEHGLIATRLDREAADRMADEHLTRCLAEARS